MTEEQKAAEQKLSHPALVMALCKSGKDILLAMSYKQAHLLHMAIGISGEAGELLDACVLEKSPDDKIEELGDIEFYMEGLRQGLGFDYTAIAELTNEYSVSTNVPAELRLTITASFILDLIKKHVIYNQPLQRLALFTEGFARMEVYLALFRLQENITREETLEHNIAKLSVRYGKQYSDEAASARADKVVSQQHNEDQSSSLETD